MGRTTREQIVDAAVRVVAREGSHGLSFAKVVDEAKLSSTRLISYHFGTRDALLKETFAHVLAQAADFMSPRIAAESSIRAKIRTYILSNLEFVAQDAIYARAAVDLSSNLGTANSADGLALLEAGFREGQQSGELRDFDVRSVAVALRGAIDASVLAIVNDGADAKVAGRELSELFDRAISA